MNRMIRTTAMPTIAGTTATGRGVAADRIDAGDWAS
jgi:hypothetical protein